jgi:hypothetical protein
MIDPALLMLEGGVGQEAEAHDSDLDAEGEDEDVEMDGGGMMEVDGYAYAGVNGGHEAPYVAEHGHGGMNGEPGTVDQEGASATNNGYDCQVS